MNTTAIVRRRKRHLLLPAVSCLSAFYASQGNTQVTEDNVSALEEVIVTAQKRDQSAQDIPIAISAITDKDLQNLGITGLDALQDVVPGLTLLSIEPGSYSVSMRGIGALGGGLDSVAPIGYYIDEAPVTVGVGSMPDVALWDIDRVEVLRGPQGTLFGDGSMGGTIRVITNKPDAGEFSGRVFASAGSIADGGEVYTVRGMVNLPLVEDKLAVRAMASYKDFGGWIDNPELGQEDANNHEVTDLRLAFRWTPNQSLVLDYSYSFDDLDIGATNEQTAPGEFHPQSLFENVPCLTAFYCDPVTGIGRPQITNNRSVREYQAHNLTVNWDLGFAELVSSTSHFIQEFTTIDDFSPFFFAFFLPPPGGAPFLSGGTSEWTRRNELNVTTQELRLVSTGEHKLKWTVGMFYKKDDRENNTTLDWTIFDLFFPGNTVPIFREDESDILGESWAAFAEIDYALTDKISLQFGARYYEDERENFFVVIQPNFFFGDVPGQVNGSDGAKEDAVSPKLALTYTVNDRLMVFAKAAKGFRSGGINTNSELAFATTGSIVPASYGPEELWSYEIGLKSQPTDWLRANIYFYWNDWTDLHVANVSSDGLWNFTDNAGEAESQGVELELRVAPNESLLFDLNVSYNDSEVTDGGPGIESGTEVPGVPELTGSLSGSYSFAVSDQLTGSVHFAYFYRDELFGGANNNPQTLSDRYHKATLRGGVAADNWQASLFVDNLFDSDDSAVSTGVINNVDVVYKQFMQPRTIGLELQLDF